MTLKDKFRPLVWFNSGSFNVHQNKQKDENSIKCEKIADEFAIDLAIFVSKNYTYSNVAECWLDSYNLLANPITSEELLEIFKKEKGYDT